MAQEPTPHSIVGVLSLLPPDLRSQITERQEQDILRALVAGISPAEIAQRYVDQPER